MKKHPWIFRVLLAACALTLALAVCRVTVVYDAVPPPVEAGGEAAVELTIAERYCADNWESKILPVVEERAIDLYTFVEGLRGDLPALGAAHAARANETSAWSFCLDGRAKVLEVENAEAVTKKRLVLDVAPYDGQADLKAQISSVIKTNAVRDAVGFLKLDDFANQVEFAELTKAFNARLQADLIKGLDAAALVGKEIEVLGCVSVTGKAGEEVLVVPIRIDVVEG
jgi:predicted lipoprotein